MTIPKVDKLSVPIFCNGILNDAGSAKGWTDDATTWWMQRTGRPAEKFENEVGVLTRRFKQQPYASELAHLIRSWGAKGHRIDFVGHSNAADLLSRALRLLREDGERPPILRRVILIAGAVHADVNRSGFAEALARNEIERLWVTVSPKDRMLRLARISSALVGWTGLGYGTLGIDGPSRDLPGLTVIKSSLDHSDWFSPIHLPMTRKFIARILEA